MAQLFFQLASPGSQPQGQWQKTQAIPYRIDLQWWVMFGLAGLIAIGIAFATVSYTSVRAALANPAEALRDE